MGGCTPSSGPRLPIPCSPSPIPSLFILLHTLLRSPKTQPFSFQAIPHSLPKTPGVGGASTPTHSAERGRHASAPGESPTPIKQPVCRKRYLSGGSASDVLLEAVGLPAKLFSGHNSVVYDYVGGCDG